MAGSDILEHMKNQQKDIETSPAHPTSPEQLLALRDLFVENLLRARWLRGHDSVYVETFRMAIRDLHQRFPEILVPQVRPLENW